MTLLQILPAFILWSVVIARIIGLRFGWKPGILKAMVLVSTGTTLNIDLVYLALDAWLGNRNILNLIVHVALGLGMTELSRLVVAATGASTARWRLLVLMGTALAAAQGALMFSTSTPGSATNFTDVFAGVPAIAWYQGLFFTWIGLITAYTGIECMRRNRAGETASFRMGFDIIAVSCLFGVLAVATKLLLVVQEVAGAENSLSDAAYVGYRVLIALTLLGFAVGFGLPAYGRARQQWADRVQRRNALMRLQPIVSRLRDTDAGQRAGEAAALSLRPRTSKDQLYRWVIFVDDIRVASPELLSADEIELLDDIEAGFAEPGPLGAPVPTGS
ncbi:hypothetical protein [Arthrobacter sp. ISL-72]|uniref:hypothetical protein n=1 Tax=Arthrobacter sp. ISL-72 TaxID=2819114 RepID=UPI001BE86A59|nr:hypothetical protein [Arthrobacter sp. ISL-72]MBT2594057.1 hypothetical protein [Arthrobacter sp. ISL-72]